MGANKSKPQGKGKEKAKGKGKEKTELYDANGGIRLEDFQIMSLIGRGGFGKVYLVRNSGGDTFALKVMNKALIIEKKAINLALAERTILERVNHPFIVCLRYAFQSNEKLYLVLDYVNGGELFFHLRRLHRFEENLVRLYAAELILAISHLHANDIVYRDLKPENILVDSDGHVRITDFGLSKILPENSLTNTMCGSPCYIAPEILTGEYYGKAVDYWALGNLIFQMLTGRPPFYHENKNVMYQKIVSANLQCPRYLSANAISLVEGLLKRNVQERLSVEKLVVHPFFEGIDWGAVYRREVVPSFKPTVQNGKTDTTNVDRKYLEADITECGRSTTPDNSDDDPFRNYNFNGAGGEVDDGTASSSTSAPSKYGGKEMHFFGLAPKPAAAFEPVSVVVVGPSSQDTTPSIAVSSPATSSSAQSQSQPQTTTPPSSSPSSTSPPGGGLAPTAAGTGADGTQRKASGQLPGLSRTGSMRSPQSKARVLEGIVLMRGRKSGKWVRMYLVIETDGVFKYWADDGTTVEPTNAPVALIPLSTLTAVVDQTYNPTTGFEVIVAGKASHHLNCESTAERDKWIAALSVVPSPPTPVSGDNKAPSAAPGLGLSVHATSGTHSSSGSSASAPTSTSGSATGTATDTTSSTASAPPVSHVSASTGGHSTDNQVQGMTGTSSPGAVDTTTGGGTGTSAAPAPAPTPAPATGGGGGHVAESPSTSFVSSSGGDRRSMASNDSGESGSPLLSFHTALNSPTGPEAGTDSPTSTSGPFDTLPDGAPVNGDSEDKPPLPSRKGSIVIQSQLRKARLGGHSPLAPSSEPADASIIPVDNNGRPLPSTSKGTRLANISGDGANDGGESDSDVSEDTVGEGDYFSRQARAAALEAAAALSADGDGENGRHNNDSDEDERTVCSDDSNDNNNQNDREDGEEEEEEEGGRSSGRQAGLPTGAPNLKGKDDDSDASSSHNVHSPTSSITPSVVVSPAVRALRGGPGSGAHAKRRDSFAPIGSSPAPLLSSLPPRLQSTASLRHRNTPPINVRPIHMLLLDGELNAMPVVGPDGVAAQCSFVVSTTSSVEEALKMIADNPDSFTFVLAEVDSPHCRGASFLTALSERGPDLPLPVVLIGKANDAGRFMDRVAGFVLRPLQKANLLECAVHVVGEVSTEDLAEDADAEFARYGITGGDDTTSSAASAVLSLTQEDVIVHHHLNDETRSWFREYMNAPVELVDQHGSEENEVVNDEGPLGESVRGLDFNVFSLDGPSRMIEAVVLMFSDLGLLSTFNISRVTLTLFVEKIAASMSVTRNAFHTFAHVVDVVHLVYWMIEFGGASSYLSATDVLSLMIAALGQAAGHPGVTNAFLVRNHSTLAVTYHGRSVLQHHHCATLFEALTASDLLLSLAPATADAIKRSVVDTILATDPASHFDVLRLTSEAARGTARSGVTRTNGPTRALCCQLLLKTAQHAHLTRMWAVAHLWADLYVFELNAQNLKEKALREGSGGDEAEGDHSNGSVLDNSLVGKTSTDVGAGKATASLDVTPTRRSGGSFPKVDTYRGARVAYDLLTVFLEPMLLGVRPILPLATVLLENAINNRLKFELVLNELEKVPT